MTVKELLDLIDQYVEQGCLDLDTAVAIEVWHDDESAETYPLTTASGHVDRKSLTLHARGDDPNRN